MDGSSQASSDPSLATRRNRTRRQSRSAQGPGASATLGPQSASERIIQASSSQCRDNHNTVSANQARVVRRVSGPVTQRPSNQRPRSTCQVQAYRSADISHCQSTVLEQVAPPKVSAMHRCIFIDEIFRNITEELFLMHWHDALAKLARTCKALHEVVLPVLWRRLEDLRPLERLVGRVVGVRELPENSHEDPPPTVGRARLEDYMTQVQEFHWSHGWHWDGLCELADTVLASEPQIFPQLRVLRWVDTREDAFPYIRRFLAPTLRDLCIWMPHYTLPEIVALLQTASVICTEVRTCHVRINNQWRPHMSVVPESSLMAEPLVQCIAKMQHLREFAADIWFPGGLLAPLGALRGLEMLELTCPELVVLTSGPAIMRLSGQEWFPSLRRLSLYLPQLDKTFLDFLRSIQSTRLAELAIRVYRTPSGDLLQQQLAAIVRMPLHHTLHSFSLLCVSKPARGQPRLVVDAGHALRPLYSLPQIKHISLHLNHIAVDSCAINDIAHAWSELKTLSLLGRYAHPPSRDRLTLQNLVPLAQRCPQLAKVALHFSATSPPNERELARLFPGPSRCRLRKLVAHDAPIADLGGVASFTRRAFPEARDVSYKPLEQGLGRRVGRRPVSYDEEWETVRKMLRGRRPAGKQEDILDGRAHTRASIFWDGFPYASSLFD
ncbi:hypothetical protein OH77DRAFT_1586308 [Trametes cingulata]|nr:hypothetical protein OH77DRAFT_1586308 [Trametes cingulata]